MRLDLLLQPEQGKDLPRIMQWIGDTRRVLATLRYIHANPKAAGVRKGFHDPWSNYGHYERTSGWRGMG